MDNHGIIWEKGSLRMVATMSPCYHMSVIYMYNHWIGLVDWIGELH